LGLALVATATKDGCGGLVWLFMENGKIHPCILPDKITSLFGCINYYKLSYLSVLKNSEQNSFKIELIAYCYYMFLTEELKVFKALNASCVSAFHVLHPQIPHTG
jgi:hypothetical protein